MIFDRELEKINENFYFENYKFFLNFTKAEIFKQPETHNEKKFGQKILFPQIVSFLRF
jgi:hypothetical protein